MPAAISSHSQRLIEASGLSSAIRRPLPMSCVDGRRKPCSVSNESGGKTPRSPARLLPSTCRCYHPIDPPIRPIRTTMTTTRITILRILILQGGLAVVRCVPHENSPHNTPVFRPGSGAGGSIHGSSSAIATSLQSVHSLKDLDSLKGSGTQRTDGTDKSSGRPLLSLDQAVGVATVALFLCSCATVSMMHRSHHGHGHHDRDGPRQPGTSHIPPHHIGKVPPFFDPRFEHKYSFRQYMKEMQH